MCTPAEVVEGTLVQFQTGSTSSSFNRDSDTHWWAKYGVSEPKVTVAQLNFGNNDTASGKSGKYNHVYKELLTKSKYKIDLAPSHAWTTEPTPDAEGNFEIVKAVWFTWWGVGKSMMWLTAIAAVAAVFHNLEWILEYFIPSPEDASWWKSLIFWK